MLHYSFIVKLDTFLSLHFFREFGDNVPEENIRGAVERAFQLEQSLAAVRQYIKYIINTILPLCIYSFQYLKRIVEMQQNFTIHSPKQN